MMLLAGVVGTNFWKIYSKFNVFRSIHHQVLKSPKHWPQNYKICVLLHFWITIFKSLWVRGYSRHHPNLRGPCALGLNIFKHFCLREIFYPFQSPRNSGGCGGCSPRWLLKIVKQKCNKKRILEICRSILGLQLPLTFGAYEGPDPFKIFLGQKSGGRS